VDDALEAIDRSGYVVLPGVVPVAPLVVLEDHLANEYRRVSTHSEMFRGGGTVSGHLNCYPGERSRVVYERIRDYGVLDIVAARDPANVDRIRATMNYNLPGSYDQHFHADGLYTDEFLICNIAVVDTDLDNGAIDLLPGTHERFYKFWQYATQRKYRSSTRVCMRRGDVLLRLSTTWHRGRRNHTTRPRPMMSLTFGETSAPDGDPFRVADGDVSFLPNWYGTSRLAEAKERAFVTVPGLYSTFRFARSLIGNKGYSSW
jgi:hypothetical protein